MDLRDRLNWQQACTVLGCSKSTLYRLVEEEILQAYGVGKRSRWYSRVECLAYLEKNLRERNR